MASDGTEFGMLAESERCIVDGVMCMVLAVSVVSLSNRSPDSGVGL